MKDTTEFKNIIKEALKETNDLVSSQTPQYKDMTKYSGSLNVNPLEITKFMKDNNIPEDAEFDTIDNENNGYEGFVLSWVVKVPTTNKDKIKFIRDRFNHRAFKFVSDNLIKQHYERKPFDSLEYNKLKRDNDVVKLYGKNPNFVKLIYDMYIAEDFDRLTNYYSLFFKLK